MITFAHLAIVTLVCDGPSETQPFSVGSSELTTNRWREDQPAGQLDRPGPRVRTRRAAVPQSAEPDGRRVRYRVDVGPIREALRWLAAPANDWDVRLGALARHFGPDVGGGG